MVQIGHAVLEPNTIFALPLPFPLRVLLSFSPAFLFLPGDTVLCKQKCAGRHTILTASLCCTAQIWDQLLPSKCLDAAENRICFTFQLLCPLSPRQGSCDVSTCAFFAAGTTRQSNTRQIAAPQHVLCLAAAIPWQSKTRQTATFPHVLFVAAGATKSSNTRQIVMSQHVHFLAAAIP